MKSWTAPQLPQLDQPAGRPRVFDTATRCALTVPNAEIGTNRAVLYVCGITPYDATHLGHAATYVAFDTLNRVWRDAGLDVVYVQNTTDVDDPLLERAAATGQDWRELAESQIELFRQDMEALRVLPPEHYMGAVETVPLVVDAVTKLIADGSAYQLPTGDVYYAIRTPVEPAFGSVSNYDAETMATLFAERGGDPDTPGKTDPLDPLLWRAAREGEPSWPGQSLGDGRPGWHIECAAIAIEYAGLPLTVQGGGDDLIFPHHEMCAAHAQRLTGRPFSDAYMHSGMVGLDGEKMSKSRGNLVFVSRLRQQGTDPMAIRLVLLSHHYRSAWNYSDEDLEGAAAQLQRWRGAAARGSALDADEVISRLRDALADDLDTVRALRAIDDWAAAQPEGVVDEKATAVVVGAVDALLGIDLLQQPQLAG